jgi:hypothetical protein
VIVVFPSNVIFVKSTHAIGAFATAAGAWPASRTAAGAPIAIITAGTPTQAKTRWLVTRPPRAR